MNAIQFSLEPDLPATQFINLLARSTLSERRPIGEIETITAMLRNADIVLVARARDGLLIGVSRAITDYSYCTYLSDLAVDTAFQRQGIGRELVRRTHEAAGFHTMLVLLAAPQAKSYYRHIGMRAHDSCWVTDRQPRA